MMEQMCSLQSAAGLGPGSGGEIVVLHSSVEQCGYCPVQASTFLFFLIPKNVKSERPTALLLTPIRW